MNIITTLIGLSLISTVGLLNYQKPQEAPTEVKTVEVISEPDLTTKAGIEAYIRSKDWNGQEDIAVKIAICESGLNPKAYNGVNKDRSVGLFQINLYGNLAKSRPNREWLEDPKNNIDYAHEMFLKENFRPWTCARKV